MDIRGVDLTFTTPLDLNQALEAAIKAIEGVWGTSIVEIDSPTEVFVYSSKEAVDAWNEYGWNEQYATSMIDVISRTPGEVTIVLESEEDPVLAQIIVALREALK
jgi:hypothetical protein